MSSNLLQTTISDYLDKREELVNFLGIHDNYMSATITDATDEEWTWDDDQLLDIAGESNEDLYLTNVWEQPDDTVFEISGEFTWFIILSNDMRVVSE